jgi:nitrite reductase (NO-forming)
LHHLNRSLLDYIFFLIVKLWRTYLHVRVFQNHHYRRIYPGNQCFTAEALPCLITKHVLLTAGETRVQIAPDNGLTLGGRWYNAMTWNNAIPGPVISVDQGDCLKITVKNNGALIHSLDFHAGNGPSNAIGCGSIPALTTKECPTLLHADTPGFFMYHCAGDAINGIWEHIANGMYGGIVVHPREEKPAKEFYMVFGEIYPNSVSRPPAPPASFDLTRLKADNPEYILTNGMAFKYVTQIGTTPPFVLNPAAEVFKVKPGELTRWYIVNAGPNDDVAFHFISGLISVHDGLQGTGGVASGQLGTQLTNDETWNIPAGSASVIESTFPEEGIYVGVDHSMKDVVKGGAFMVKAADSSTPTDHPRGTWVPPKGSPIAVGHPF